MSELGKYDLDRAARAGGFESEMDLGREVARIMHSAISARIRDKEPVSALQVAIDTVHGVAEELYDEDPRPNGFWLSVMHNSVNDMYRDLRDQCAEAQGIGAVK
jgi:hypothetical protein